MGRNLTICLVLIAATVSVYGQVLGFQFVAYDDDGYVTQNRIVQSGLTAKGFVWALTTEHRGYWHPVTWLSHMLDCQLYGLKPWGHHLTNLVLHVLNTLLLFGLLRRLTGPAAPPWPGAFVAALFALHPLHVESVAWVSERKDLLSTCLGLLCLWSYVGYAKCPGMGRYLATALLLALGLMAKPMLVTLPVLFLLLDYWPLERFRSEPQEGVRPVRPRRPIHLLAEKIPLLLVCAASSVATFLGQSRQGVMDTADTIPIPLRIDNAIVSYALYLVKMVWPSNLSVLYPHPNLPGGTPWTQWHVGGAALLLLAISAAVVWSKRQGYALVGWLWYLGTLVPVIGLVQVGSQGMADRYTYVPLVGLFIMVAWAAADLAKRPGLIAHRVRLVIAPAGVAVLAACMICTGFQARHWRDPEALFVQALKATPSNPLIHSNLAVVLASQGEPDRAKDQFMEAIRLKPNYEMAYFNLGILLSSQGQIGRAIDSFRRALEIWPNYAEAHHHLGAALDKSGRAEEALVHLREAARHKPGWPLPLTHMAWILATHPDAAVRDPQEAIQLAKRAAELTGHRSPAVLDTLAATWAAAGDFDRARRTAQAALALAFDARSAALTSAIRRRLDLYRQGKPYRQATPLDSD